MSAVSSAELVPIEYRSRSSASMCRWISRMIWKPNILFWTNCSSNQNVHWYWQYSHQNIPSGNVLFQPEARALGKPPPSQLAVACLGPGLDQPELGLRQLQVAADLFGRLLLEIEANQHLPCAFGQPAQQARGDILALLLDHPAFRVGLVVGERHRRVDRLLVAPRVYSAADVRRHLPPDHRAHITHQPVRLAEFAPLDGLRDDQENVVHLVVQGLRPQLPPQQEAPGRAG